MRFAAQWPPLSLDLTVTRCGSSLLPHDRDYLELFSTLSMAREFISDYADTNSGNRRVVPESLGKERLSSEVRIRTFKKSR